jgi:ribosomal protein L16/L10AE
MMADQLYLLHQLRESEFLWIKIFPKKIIAKKDQPELQDASTLSDILKD